MARIKLVMVETVKRWKQGQTYTLGETLAKQFIENKQATFVENVACGCKGKK